MTRYLIGLETNYKETFTPNLAAAIADVLGPGGLTMLWFNGTSVYEADCDWNWGHVDHNIRTLMGAGLYAPWLKMCGIPALGTIEGHPTYDKYTRGVQRWKRDANGNPLPGSAAIDESLYYFKNPARPDPDWIRECARRLTDRYFVQPILRGNDPVISAALCENEFDDATYFPPVKAWEPNYRKAFELAWSNIVVPFAEGMRQAQSSAEFSHSDFMPLPLIGPETAYDGLRDMLELERGAHVYNFTSFHGYCETKPETLAGALETLDKRMEMVRPFRQARGVVIGEMGDAGGGGWIVDYLEEAPKRYDSISAIVTHGWERFITCVNPNDPEESRQYMRNETGARLRALIEKDREQARRRASVAAGESS